MTDRYLQPRAKMKPFSYNLTWSVFYPNTVQGDLRHTVFTPPPHQLYPGLPLGPYNKSVWLPPLNDPFLPNYLQMRSGHLGLKLHPSHASSECLRQSSLAPGHTVFTGTRNDLSVTQHDGTDGECLRLTPWRGGHTAFL